MRLAKAGRIPLFRISHVDITAMWCKGNDPYGKNAYVDNYFCFLFEKYASSIISEYNWLLRSIK